MIKIVTIVGARPQFIKAAPVSRAIKRQEGLREVLIHTGQHFDQNMSEVFFDQMEIPRPRHFLNIHSLSHGAMTGRMLEEAESIMIKEKPDIVMVYGDTNSTLAGALAAAKLNVPVAHVEAGLRSQNMEMPEEINRILADRLSRILFCPTEAAVNNLTREGFRDFPCEIHLTGDVMYDASLLFADKARKPAKVSLPANYVLATIHREANTKNLVQLANIIHGINQVAKKHAVVFPVHPRTSKVIQHNDIPPLSENIKLIEPVGYFEMLHLLQNSQLVMTDSGGVQKEAYFFKIPCITLRNETEWTELVDAGYNKLCGTDPDQIHEAARDFFASTIDFKEGLYGNGSASAKIAKALSKNRL